MDLRDESELRLTSIVLNGNPRLSGSALPLRPIIEEAVELTSSLARSRHVAVDLADSTGPLSAWCERGRVLQILVELISNAVKLSEPGATVTVWTFDEGEVVRVFVRDDGPSLEPDVKYRLYDPWSHATRESEHGVGLYLSQRIARSLGGSLSVRACATRGCVFELALLAREPGAAPTARA